MNKKIKWCLPVLVTALLGLSAPTQAEGKIKLLLAPGAISPAFGFIAADYLDKGDVSGSLGYGIALDLNFPGSAMSFALDVYNQPSTKNSNVPLNGAYLVEGARRANRPAAEISQLQLAIVGAQESGAVSRLATGTRSEDAAALSLLLGTRWNHRSGFYLGGGVLVIDGSTTLTNNYAASPELAVAVANAARLAAEKGAAAQAAGTAATAARDAAIEAGILAQTSPSQESAAAAVAAVAEAERLGAIAQTARAEVESAAAFARNTGTVQAAVGNAGNSANGKTSGGELTYAPAFTIGYDYAFNNGLTLGVHVMRSLATDLKQGSFSYQAITGVTPAGVPVVETLTADATANNFYMQSISLGLGYSW